MIKWEYMLYRKPFISTEFFDIFGEQGWELVNVTDTAGKFTAFFKRPVRPNPLTTTSDGSSLEE